MRTACSNLAYYAALTSAVVCLLSAVAVKADSLCAYNGTAADDLVSALQPALSSLKLALTSTTAPTLYGQASQGFYAPPECEYYGQRSAVIVQPAGKSELVLSPCSAVDIDLVSK